MVDTRETRTMKTTTRIYAEKDIMEAVHDYAVHHEVETDEVSVTRNHDNDGRIIGFRLSLDVDGRSRGCDEKFGAW